MKNIDYMIVLRSKWLKERAELNVDLLTAKAKNDKEAVRLLTNKLCRLRLHIRNITDDLADETTRQFEEKERLKDAWEVKEAYMDVRRAPVENNPVWSDINGAKHNGWNLGK